jgi:hypothetical protein
MDIDERIAAYAQRSKYQPTVDKGCVGRLLEMHPDRAADIRKVVDASWVIGCAKAADILNDEGLGPIADQAIRRHRRTPPGCACQTR